MDAMLGLSNQYDSFKTTEAAVTSATKINDRFFKEQIKKASEANAIVENASTAPSFSRERERARLRDASNQLEGIFINMMMKSMRATINKENFLNGGMAETIFEDMLYEEYANDMAKTSSLGISDMIYNQMERYI